MALSERPPGWLSSSTKYGPGEIRGYPVCMVNASKSSIKADILEITTDQYSNIGLHNYGYNVENTIAVYVIDGITSANILAKLYTYNGLLFVTLSDSNTETTKYPNIKVKLKILHI